MLRNTWLKWFENRMQYRRLLGRSLRRRGRTAAQNRPVPVHVGEVLEERTLLTTYFVDTTVDESDGNFGAGDLSLREAMQLADANPGADIIRFAAGLDAAVFNITQGALPTIDTDLQIIGTIGKAQTINGAGLVVSASGPGNSTTFSVNSVNINLEPTGAGLLVTAVNDGVANVTIFNSRITNSATQGVKFVAHTGGVVNLTLGTVSILSNGDVVQSEGILGEVGVDAMGAQSLVTPGKFATANLDFNNIRVSGQFLEGFRLSVAKGGKVTTPNAIRNSAFNDNGAGNQRSAVKFNVTDAGSSLAASFSSTVADRATGTGFEFHSTNGASLNIGMTTTQALRARADAMSFTVNAATATVNVNGFIGNTAGDNGVEFTLTNGAMVNVNTFNNVQVNSAVNTGLQIGTLSGSTLSAFNSTGVTANNNGGSGALLTTLASTSNFNFTNLTTNNNVIRGVQVGVNSAGTSTEIFNNLTATGNKLAQPMGIGVRMGSVLNLTVMGGTMSSAGAGIGINNVYAPIALGSTANLTFDGVNMNNSTSSGIVASYDNASQGTINVLNTTSTNNRTVGVALFAYNGSDIDANFTNVNLSGAGQAGPANGIRLDIIGAGSTGDFTFNGVNVDGAKGQGISLLYNAGATGTVNQFNNVMARNTGGDGVNINVNGVGSQLTTFAASGVNVNGAGLGVTNTSDGLDINVAGPGAIGNFNIQNLSADSAGGRGVKIQGNNTATIGLSITGFSIDSNGLEGVAIDLGTVVAGTKMLGAVFSNGTASSNGRGFMQTRAGIRSTVSGAGTNAGITFDAVSTASNTADGFSLTGNTGATFNVDLRNGSSALGNAANGVNFRGDGATTKVGLSSTVGGNNYSGNGAAGVNVRLTNGVTANDVTVRGSATINQGDGVNISDDGTGVTINNLQVTGSAQFNNNMMNGLVINLNGTLGISTLDLSSLTVNNNRLDQINVTLANMSLTDLLLNNISAVGPGAAVGLGDGVEVTFNNASVTNTLALNGITATNNGEDGLQLNFLNGATIPMTSAIDIGRFDRNAQDGIHITITSSTIALSLTNSTANMGTISSASNNGRHGLNVELNTATLTMADIDHQAFSNNGGNGVNIQAATPSTYNSGNSFTNNTIAGNLGFGYRATFNGGVFDIAIGEMGGGNTFDENVGAGILIDMIQTSAGKLRIVDNVITGTRAGTGVFNGHGIFVRQLGTVNPAQATNNLRPNAGDPGGTPGLLIQNNRIGVDGTGMADANAGHGITFRLEEQSSVNGLHVFDNFVSNNTDGFNLVRLDQVNINNFQVLRNEFTQNRDDGLELLGQNDTTDVMFVTANDNEISRNGDNGISGQVNADARINLNLNNNMIIRNGTDGIQTREVILDISDEREFTGSWTNNVIADNTRNGIRLGAVTGGGFGGFLAVSNNSIGATFDQFGQVVIDGNGSTGVEINSAGVSTWTNNNVIRNGRLVQNDRSQGHGFDIQQAGFKSTTLTRNTIRENFQDGVEFNNNTGTFFFTLTLDDNRIQNNQGRGLDVLNQGDADSSIVIRSSSNNRANNQFSSNDEEGIYIVNTASTTQNQTNFSGTALQQDGSINANPTLELSIRNATISNNGSEGVNGQMIASAGLLLRVGTAGRGPVTATAGTLVSSFATDGFSPTPINPGVSAEFADSSLHGNFGDDVFIHGYTSTVDPATLAGTWDDMNFGINNPNNGDPLARLDLVWGLSDFDSVDVNNSARRGTPGGQAGAYYNNAETTFKSRAGNMTPGSPFNNSGTRRRNAQRVPARTLSDGSVLAPGSAPADRGRFVYPGMGESTFRVRSTSGASLAPFGSTAFTGAIAGELPFTWGGFQPTKTMGSNITFIEGGPAVPIDSTGAGNISDPVLDGLNNYNGASISVFRQGGGGAAEDVFGFNNGNGLTLVGNQIQKAGVSIASFVQAGGTLTINFTSAGGQIPTSTDVDNVLRQITYQNISPVPPLPNPMPPFPMPSLTLTVVFSNGVPPGSQAVCFVDVTIIPVNSQPVILNLGPAGIFGGTPVTLDTDLNADVQDVELDFINNGQGNYAMATLTVQRQGGANANDTFGFNNGNGLTLNGTNIQRAGQTIATFMNMNGTLTIAFTDANGVIPRSVDVDNILRQITYSNTNATPPSSVTLLVTINDGGVGGGGAQQGTALVTVFINRAPAIANLGPADVFITGGPPVAIENNANANITDAELDAANDYNGASLTIARQGGANPDDNFSFTAGNGLTLTGNEIRKAGQSIASFNVAAGTLTIVFTNANGQTPTSADADNVLRQITYQNTNATPPSSVILDVTFDDGGVGGMANQQATASVTVNINTTPAIANWGPANVFTTLGTPVLLDNDGNADISDLELDNLNDYANSVLTIARQGGANADDNFSFQSGSGLALVGGNIIKNGQSIATFAVNAGTLTVAFTNANGEAPTSVDVDNILRQITYQNTNAAPPASVTLDATFDDGGVAGLGAQQATASVTVTIV